MNCQLLAGAALALSFCIVTATDGLTPPQDLYDVGSDPAGKPKVMVDFETTSVRLNQLVTRLLRAADQSEETSWVVTRERPGWLFLTVTAAPKDGQAVRLGVDVNDPAEAQLVLRGTLGTAEEMLEVAAGKHDVRLWLEGGVTAELVEVRAIPELRYDRYYPNDILDEDLGDDDQAFLEAYAMDHLTTISADWHWNASALMDPWMARNRAWYTNSGNIEGTQQELEIFYNSILEYPSSVGIGVDFDEFGSGNAGQWNAWTGALITATAYYPDTPLALYIGTPFAVQLDMEASLAFAEAMVGLGHNLLLEWYIPEQASEADLDAELDLLSGAWTEVCGAVPGLRDHAILVLGTASVAPVTYEIRPKVNFKVHLDRQFGRIANDGSFRDLHGLGMWTSNYMDLESIRWVMALYRHYGIEGATSPLSEDGYLPDHVENPDFETGGGWAFETSGQIGLGEEQSIGEYEARWTGPYDLGDTYLYMTRGNGVPGRATQVLTGLEAGRTYSLFYDTIWYEDLYNLYGGGYNYERDHPVRADLEGARVVSDSEVVIACESTWPATGVWVNQHRLRFVPYGDTVTLTLTDRETEVWETHFFNFVQVQPFFEE